MELFDPAILLLSICTKEWEAGTQTGICTPVYTAALFTKAKVWQQPKHPLMDEWVSKMWSTHATEYYTAIKREGILTNVTTWVSLDDIMPREISQSHKDKYCMIPFI